MALFFFVRCINRLMQNINPFSSNSSMRAYMLRTPEEREHDKIAIGRMQQMRVNVLQHYQYDQSQQYQYNQLQQYQDLQQYQYTNSLQQVECNNALQNLLSSARLREQLAILPPEPAPIDYLAITREVANGV